MYEHFIIDDYENNTMSRTNKTILDVLTISEIKHATIGYFIAQHHGVSPTEIIKGMYDTDRNVYDFFMGVMHSTLNDKIIDAMFSNLHYVLTANEWKRKKQIYLFDSDFASELSNTDTKITLPTGIFDRLPYRTLYLDFSNNSSICKLANMDGCIVSVDPVTVSDKEYNVIRFVTYRHGKSGSVRVLIVASDTMLEFSAQDIDYCLTGGADSNAEELVDITKVQAGTVLKSLLYLCSYEPDIRETVVSKQRVRQSKKSKQTPIREFSVGQRFGEAFRAWTKGTLGAQHSTGTGQHKKPHVRRAHWHRFWVGKKNSPEREIIIRWVSECFCGVSDSKELDAVKHKVNSAV